MRIAATSLFLLAALTACSGQPAQTQDATPGAVASVDPGGSTGTRGGGDGYALEFRDLANTVANELKQTVIAVPGFDLAKFEALIAPEASTIESTDQPLRVSPGDTVVKTAINEPDTRHIIIQRTSWDKLIDHHLREVLVLHEYLGLMRIDDNQFKISSRLLPLGSSSEDSVELLNGNVPDIMANVRAQYESYSESKLGELHEVDCDIQGIKDAMMPCTVQFNGLRDYQLKVVVHVTIVAGPTDEPALAWDLASLRILSYVPSSQHPSGNLNDRAFRIKRVSVLAGAAVAVGSEQCDSLVNPVQETYAGLTLHCDYLLTQGGSNRVLTVGYVLGWLSWGKDGSKPVTGITAIAGYQFQTGSALPQRTNSWSPTRGFPVSADWIDGLRKRTEAANLALHPNDGVGGYIGYDCGFTAPYNLSCEFLYDLPSDIDWFGTTALSVNVAYEDDVSDVDLSDLTITWLP